MSFNHVRVPALCLIALGLPLAGTAQDPMPQQPPTPPPGAQKQTGPDYPDPRTFTIGIWGWGVIPGNGPDLLGGKTATGYETLLGLGKDHITPGLELSIPITRTGEIHAEGFLTKGTGSQIAPADTTLFGVGYNKGDYLATQYQITSAKIYLDDLLFPYKFPVQKFRLKSLWEAQWLAVHSTIDAPLKPPNSTTSTFTTSGTKTIILPTFGVAAEYAIKPHVLLRADGSWFGLPHGTLLWDAEGVISYRHNWFEIRGGYKITHYKTSPDQDEYFRGQVHGGFIGVRYHWH